MKGVVKDREKEKILNNQNNLNSLNNLNNTYSTQANNPNNTTDSFYNPPKVNMNNTFSQSRIIETPTPLKSNKQKIVSLDLYSYTNANESQVVSESPAKKYEKIYDDPKEELEDFVKFDKSKIENNEKKDKKTSIKSPLDLLFMTKQKQRLNEQKENRKMDVLTHKGKLDFKLGFKK